MNTSKVQKNPLPQAPRAKEPLENSKLGTVALTVSAFILGILGILVFKQVLVGGPIASYCMMGVGFSLTLIGLIILCVKKEAPLKTTRPPRKIPSVVQNTPLLTPKPPLNEPKVGRQAPPPAPKFQLKITPANLKNIARVLVEASLESTIDEILQDIEHKIGYLKTEMTLIHEGTRLNQMDRTLKSYNLSELSDIRLVIKIPFEITIVLPEGRGEFPFQITPKETLDSVKKRLVSLSDIPARNLKLKIKDGRVIETTEDLRTLVREDVIELSQYS